jgi:phosphate transport system substrate-binding protein
MRNTSSISGRATSSFGATQHPTEVHVTLARAEQRRNALFVRPKTWSVHFPFTLRFPDREIRPLFLVEFICSSTSSDERTCMHKPPEKRPSRLARWVRISVIVAMVSGCGEFNGGASESDGGGTVFVTGSSTVEPISILVGEFVRSQKVAVAVEGPGTGDGFKKFCNGEGDITGASRRIKDEEVDMCASGGVDFIELPVAVDGLTVVTNRENTSVECLDSAALYALLGPESEGMKRWNDANSLAQEVGSQFVSFPNLPLSITGPGEESGTYDSFVEFAVKDIAEERGTEEFLRPDYIASGNDNLIVEGLNGSESSLGWIGYAFYVGDREEVRAIDIRNEDGDCVEPTDETIAVGTYPFSRVLYIYVNRESAIDNMQVRTYVDAYLGDQNPGLVRDAGYVPLPESTRAEAIAEWRKVS